MKIREFMEDLFAFTDNTEDRYEKTCDTLKAGNPEKDLTKVAVTMFATPSVIRAAGDWGANLLIVHEPVFYDHWDDLSRLEEFPEPRKSLVKAKQELIQQSGLTIYRYHDHPHCRVPDYISIGEVEFWGLKGTWKRGTKFGMNGFVLDQPLPVMELAKTLEKNLNIRKIRIFGSTKTLCRKLALCFGAPGDSTIEELVQNDVILTGELCEWCAGEMARDYKELLGEDKSVLVMGHIGSERDGMRLMERVIRERYPQFEVKYFESGESFTFTSQEK